MVNESAGGGRGLPFLTGKRKHRTKKSGGKPLDVQPNPKAPKNPPKTGTPPPPSSSPTMMMMMPLEEITYSKVHTMDYVLKDEVIKAIRLENMADWYFWQLKEKFDNACDFRWKYYPTNPDAGMILVKITIDNRNNLFRCSVSNNNPDGDKGRQVFKDLAQNLDFSMTAGTKQNDNIVSRGYLGDALKRIHAISQTLAEEEGISQWRYPMVFRFNHKQYTSMLNVDRMNSRIEATPILTEGKHVKDNWIEVENTWRLINKVKHKVTAENILKFCECYTLFTTDISFSIQITSDEADIQHLSQPITSTIYATTEKPVSRNWKPLSSIYSYTYQQFRNRIYAIHHKTTTTVYDFVRLGFREWNRVPKSACPELDITVAEYLKDPDKRDGKILQLLYHLRQNGETTTPPDKLNLPYTVQQERKESLIRRLYKITYNSSEALDKDRGLYDIIHKVYHDVDRASGLPIQYPYAIEIVGIPFTEEHLSVYNIGQESKLAITAINYSVSPLGINILPKDQDNNQGGYYGDFAGLGTHANKMLYELLENKGFEFVEDNNTQSTKIPCMFAINLISPVLTYLSEGKSDVDIQPFLEGVVAAAESIARKVRTFKSARLETPDLEEQREEREGERAKRAEDKADAAFQKQLRQREREAARRLKAQQKRKREDQRKQHKNVKEVVEMKLQTLYEQYKRGEKFEEDTLLNDVWYMLLPDFKKYRSIPKEDRGIRNESRPAVKKYILEFCKERKIKRSNIGIFAGIRARMYYMGKEYPVGFDEIEMLAEYGIAILFIEKGGMVEVMNRYAHDYRVALVNSEGHLTEYAKELSDLATKKGARVGVVVDYDLNGVLIAASVKGVAWLGIDKRTIERFSIPMPDPKTGFYPEEETREMVVPYESKKKPIEKSKLYDLQREDPRFGPDRMDIEWLWKGEEEYYDEKTKKYKKKIVGNKIEINAVKVDLGSEGLWNYILERMREEWNTWDFTRAINVDLDLTPPPAPTISFDHASEVVEKLNQYITDKIKNTAEDKKTEIKEELKSYPELIKAGELEQQKKQELETAVKEVPEPTDIRSVTIPILDALKTTIDEKTMSKQEEISDLQDQIDDLQAEMDEITESEVEEAERQTIIPAIKKLDKEKGYGLMKALKLDEELEAPERGSEN
jgi:hypothetical protein